VLFRSPQNPKTPLCNDENLNFKLGIPPIPLYFTPYRCVLAIQRAWSQMDLRAPHYRDQRRTRHSFLPYPVSSASPNFSSFHSHQLTPALGGSMQIYTHQTTQLSRIWADSESHWQPSI
jgi:hypothetical protein